MTTGMAGRAAATLVFIVVATWGSAEADAQTWGGDGFYEPGTVGFRLGLGLSNATTQTQDTDGKVTTENHFGGSLLLGGSYAALSRIALDLDTDLDFQFTPTFEQRQIAVTPGTRLFAFPGFYGRLASMNYLMVPINSLALVGVGYFTSTGVASFFLEINYVAWAWKDDDDHPNPTIIPRLGVSIGF